ncbi:hypothetical protein [Spirosoma rhododendri]|uniref:Uncharacterized protein n=1 Tax=Spirosoma rhododendri TaxID=2728024 RepID=A0A7L5DMB8_9BACT|nr:hypothetical protein [Spirosoma rhododendri]QJD78631.1 hypothetical protein HH216_09475 [Spirosoma rhododendri]
MTTPEEFADLLDDTMQALAFDAIPSDAAPATDVLTRWTDVLGEGINTGELTQSLTALRATIAEPNASPADLEPLLNDLASQVTTFSANVGSEGDMVTRLQALATALQDLAGKLHAASQA